MRRSSLELGLGYTERELDDIQGEYGFTFHRDHADVLREVTPEGWIDWRGDSTRVRRALEWPTEGVLFDVENGFWFSAWGERPASTEIALDLGRQHLARAPRLVPIYGHRYIPAAPEGSGAPVFSAYQTDVIYYGTDLADYCAHEFLGEASVPANHRRIPFWSDLVDGDHDIWS
ncbi:MULTISPECIES: hypothetical protein [unclassified Isoptericola]|uniref:hypothetical protein n=1 Tax=unclassified Isoptericola TaxID=2623355 RepID=UPI003666576C